MIGGSAEASRRSARAGGISYARLRRTITPYLFVAPVVLTLLFLVAYPIARVIQVSFYDDYVLKDAPTFILLDNFTAIFSEKAFLQSVLNTVVFTAGSVALHVSLGLAFALLLNRRGSARLRLLFRSIYILPWLFLLVIVTLIWKLILHPAGAVNSSLKSLGLMGPEPIDWFSSFILAMPSLIIANVWAGYAFSMLMLLAGLQSIPQDLYEAAAVDGAGAWQRFWNVTLPGLGPTIVTVALLDSIWTFRLFDLPYLLTGGGPVDRTLTLPLLTYREAFEGFRFGQSAAVAVMILIITLIFSFFYLRYRARLIEES